MRFISLLIASSALAASAPAFAQAIAPGMQVVDSTGSSVGTVTAIQGDNLLIKTDKHEMLVPKVSFTPNAGKLVFGMTQAQLDAEIEKTQSAATASVAVGATVKAMNGTEIGRIDSVADSGVVIALPSGQKVQVGRSGVRGNPDGSVTVGLTAEQLNAQLQATTPAAAAPAKPATPGKPRK
jgi:preprotein translocase subunit YajC